MTRSAETAHHPVLPVLLHSPPPRPLSTRVAQNHRAPPRGDGRLRGTSVSLKFLLLSQITFSATAPSTLLYVALSSLLTVRPPFIPQPGDTYAFSDSCSPHPQAACQQPPWFLLLQTLTSSGSHCCGLGPSPRLSCALVLSCPHQPVPRPSQDPARAQQPPKMPSAVTYS